MTNTFIIIFTVLLTGNVFAANVWQGTWGRWSENSSSGVIILKHCTGTQCDFELRTKAADNSYCNQTGRADTKNETAVLTPSANYSGEFTPNDYGCTLTMHLKDKSLQADPLSKNCEAYCTKPSAFVSKYDFASEKPLNNRTECFGKLSRAWAVFCTNEDFVKKEHKLLELQIAAEAANPDSPPSYDDRFFEKAIESCEKETNVETCLNEKYEAQKVKLTESKDSSVKIKERFEKDFTTDGNETDADQMISKIEGVYKKQFQNGLVDGTRYKSEDVFEIVRVSKSSIYFNIHLDYYNGHTCGINGLAKFSTLKKFVFKADDCRILIDTDGRKVKLDDHGGSCKSYCGARGSLSNIEFPLTKRREIKYMNRLKNSEAYKNSTK